MPSTSSPFGRHVPRAMRSIAAILAALALGACRADHGSALTGPDGASLAVASAAVKVPALLGDPEILAVPTYEGSGESVHPDVVEFPQEWHGWRYWLTMTPYPRNQSSVENPSIFGSVDGQRLYVPIGVINPIVGRAGRPKDYNSDPELLYEPDNDQLVLFYRFVDKRTNTIRVSTSKDGVQWTRSAKAFWVPTHAAVSPTVVGSSTGGRSLMWYVNSGRPGCHARSSRVVMRTAVGAPGSVADARWAEPVATDLVQPGYVIWHMKVRYVASKGEYWALYAAFPAATAATVGCETDDLFYARSTDGVHWETFPEPLLRHEAHAWSALSVYRSSFLYDPVTDELRVWASAQGNDRKWRLALARFRYGQLLGELSTPTPQGPSLAAASARPAMQFGDGAP
jgi:hypothetical protein